MNMGEPKKLLKTGVKTLTQEKRAWELLQELNHELQIIHLDMNGHHRYALSARAHTIITRIKHFLSTAQEKRIENGNV